MSILNSHVFLLIVKNQLPSIVNTVYKFLSVRGISNALEEFYSLFPFEFF